MYKVVRTSRLYEQIVRQIEDSILKGTLKSGDQLPSERELALKFGVGRTAVREAVKALHEKGLVEAYSGRGTFITNGTSQAVTQSINRMMRIDQADGSANLAEVRQILEPEIAALAGGDGPAFLLCDTYRYRGHHVGDINREFYRSKKEEQHWLAENDPIRNFSTWLKAQKHTDAASLSTIDAELKMEMNEAMKFAIAAPYPSTDQVDQDVYA